MHLFSVLWVATFSVIVRGCFNNEPRQFENEVDFLLFTTENQSVPKQIFKYAIPWVDFKKETKFIVHGYFENARSEWYQNITQEYLRKGDYNIIQVDWSKPASLSYSSSAFNTRKVGSIIGDLIVILNKTKELPLNKVHIIGHSLGAHVSAYAGKEVISQTKHAIARITALDAAGPLFERPFATFEGLSKDDAIVVDAIHTDGGIFGRSKPTGTVDFYPNNGLAPQPGCPTWFTGFPFISYVQLSKEVFCSHQKSISYFTSSINDEVFEAAKCSSSKDFERNKCSKVTAIMGDGYVADEEATGSFFLETNAEPPFSRSLNI